MQTRCGLATALCGVLIYSPVATVDVRGDDELSAQVDKLLAEYDRPDLPGCSIGIIRDGQMIYSRGFGSANLDHQVLNTPRTVFETGSFAKSITCACIAMLMDQGRLSPDDDIRDYVPELQKSDPPIRIRHLVRCRSGIWAQWHIAQIAGWYAQPVEAPYTENDMLTLLSGQKSWPFKPGEEFQYSTGDYFLLGVILKRVTGQSLPDFAQKNLFAPLGMTHTFIMQDPAKLVRHRAIGYYRHYQGDWLQWTQGSSGPGGRGLYSSVEDLQHWGRNFERNRLPSGQYMDKFISDGTLLDNRNVLDGTPTGTYRGVKRIQFTGGMPGYVAALAHFPEQRFTVICLCNNPTISPWNINEKVADIYLSGQLGPEKPRRDKDAANRGRDRQIQVDESELLDKVGAFRLRIDERIWKIVLHDGKLMVEDHMKELVPLVPMGRNRFRPNGGFFHETARFVFERESPDQPYSLTSNWIGGTVPMDRVEIVDPTPQQLSEYAGRFYCEELSTSYRFKEVDGRLMLRVNNLGWEPLDPAIADQFILGRRQAHDNRILTFLRDDQNCVVGMSVRLFRVKGVLFTKDP